MGLRIHWNTRNKLIETGELATDTENALKAALEEFKKQYAAGKK